MPATLLGGNVSRAESSLAWPCLCPGVWQLWVASCFPSSPTPTFSSDPRLPSTASPRTLSPGVPRASPGRHPSFGASLTAGSPGRPPSPRDAGRQQRGSTPGGQATPGARGDSGERGCAHLLLFCTQIPPPTVIKITSFCYNLNIPTSHKGLYYTRVTPGPMFAQKSSRQVPPPDEVTY